MPCTFRRTLYISLQIAQAALTYEPTEKIVELAKPSPWKLIKDEPLIPGHVKPEALTYKRKVTDFLNLHVLNTFFL